jgi:hypothetical protein
MSIHFEKYHARASTPSEQRNHESNRSAANGRHRFAGLDRSESNVVNRDCKRFDQRGVVVLNSCGNGVQTIRGHGPEFLKRAVGIDSEKAQVFADVSESASACLAMTAGDSWLDDNASSRLKAAGVFGTRNDGNHFMSENSTGFGALGHSSLKDQQIGSADSDAPDLKQDFAGRGLRNGFLRYFHATRPTVDRGFHVANTRLSTVLSSIQIARASPKNHPNEGLRPFEPFIELAR